MNETIIQRWNEKVSPRDIVYHLGDFCMSRDSKRWVYFLNKLNGQIHLIKGNHDKNSTIKKLLAPENKVKFADVRDYKRIKVQDKKYGNRDIVLLHYAMRTWNRCHYGSFHLYGHSHGTLYEYQDLRSMDVGVDTNNFYPYSYQEIRDKLFKKPGIKQ